VAAVQRYCVAGDRRRSAEPVRLWCGETRQREPGGTGCRLDRDTGGVRHRAPADRSTEDGDSDEGVESDPGVDADAGARWDSAAGAVAWGDDQIRLSGRRV